MDKQGRPLLWVALVTVLVIIGLVLRTRLNAPEEEPASGLSALVPQPTPTIYPSSETVVRSIQRLSRMESASFHIEKVITAETGQGPLGFLFGDRLLLIAYGEVIAGVDLGKIGPDQVARTDDGTIYMQLPPVEIFVATLDNERTRVYDRRTGVVGLNPELETEARREAQRMILEAAVEDGIEAEAETQATEFMRSFLLALGFEEVVIVDVMPTPTPIPSPTSAPDTPSS